MSKNGKLFIVFCVLLGVACKKKDKAPDYSQRTAYFSNIAGNAAPDSVLKCITYNIRLGFPGTHGDPWNRHHTGASEAYLDSLAQLILMADPDIICLQEVPRNRYNTEIKNFIERLAAAVNMNYAFGAHGYNDPIGIEPVYGEWGNAILSRYQIQDMENYENEYKDVWERRSILAARVKVGEHDVMVYSLHFLPSPQAIPNALPFFQKNAYHHQLIMGDFNMGHSPELESAGYTDIMKGDTSWSISPIDRMYVSSAKFGVVAYGGIEGSRSLSDHTANYCVLKLK